VGSGAPSGVGAALAVLSVVDEAVSDGVSSGAPFAHPARRRTEAASATAARRGFMHPTLADDAGFPQGMASGGTIQRQTPRQS
jgi:hypothetical protein